MCTIAIREGLRSRSTTALPIPYSRLSSTRNAFAHPTIKLWNSLNDDMRTADSVSNFKLHVKQHLYKKYNARFMPMLYSSIPLGRAAILHCRLRLGLSGLNYHRFTYNFISFKHCSLCTSNCENIKHYLFECPAFAAQRMVLMRDLSTKLPAHIIRDLNTLETYLIFGSPDISLNENLAIFSLVSTYLVSTGRFT